MKQLAPVGNRISSLPGALSLETCGASDGSNTVFCASGSQALALALRLAIESSSRSEVAIPAYCCPDVLSAIVYAGGHPVLIDLETDSPYMCPRDLESKIGQATAAIVAVNFLGIRERIEDLAVVANRAGAVLIEDSCQAFPGDWLRGSFRADATAFSFGRGKPLCVLGGGALSVLMSGRIGRRITWPPAVDLPRKNRVPFRLKVLAYNFVTSPSVYWALAAFPFLGVGETRFKEIRTIGAADRDTLCHLKSNFSYLESIWRSKTKDTVERLAAHARDLSVIPLECRAQSGEYHLLRFPMLAVTKRDRDEIVETLQAEGLGASKMYRNTLPKIPGVAGVLAEQGRFPVAEAFAERLFTLPTHERVGRADVERMMSIIAGIG